MIKNKIRDATNKKYELKSYVGAPLKYRTLIIH